MGQRPKQTPHQRRRTEGKYTGEKMLHARVTGRYGVKHHWDSTAHRSGGGMQNSDSTQCWRGCGHASSPQCRRNAHGAATLADSLVVSFKPKHTLTHCPATMLLGIHSKELKLTPTWRPAQGCLQQLCSQLPGLGSNQGVLQQADG